MLAPNLHAPSYFLLRVFAIPCKAGRAQGWPKGQRACGSFGPLGPLRGPWAQGAFGALGAHGGRWDYSEAIPNGIKPNGSEVSRSWRRGAQGCFSDSVKSEAVGLVDWKQPRMDGLEPILNISGPSCPSSQNGRFGSHFKQFLRQAAQVVKMDDLRAMGPIYV